MQCNALNAKGEQCRAPAMKRERYCVTHHPDHQEARHEARKRGGRRSKEVRGSAIRTVEAEDTPGPIETLEDVATWLRWLTLAVTTGRIDARTCREATASLKELRPTLEKVGMQEEVRKLREELQAARAGKP